MEASSVLLIILLGIFTLTVPLFGGLSVAVWRILKQRFGGRWDLPAFTLADFPGLVAEPRPFTTVSPVHRRGVPLSGYLYRVPASGAAPKGLIVFAPGFTSPHRQYLYYINALCEAGYLVFAYDNTAVGESGGNGLGGLEQAVYDLRAALALVRADPVLASLPQYLSGHSMGGYAVMAILNEARDIRAVVTISGFNSPVEMAAAATGAMKPLLYLPLKLVSRLRWGAVAAYSALRGIRRAADTRVLMFYSQDDPVVSPRMYRQIEHRLAGCPQVSIRCFDGRGHIPYVPTGQWPKIKARQEAFAREKPGMSPEAQKAGQESLDRELLDMERGLDKEFWQAAAVFLEECTILHGKMA
jgi:pimeloyl-ACP methyl ester carboxylesterase